MNVPPDFLSNLYVNSETYRENPHCFKISREEWSQNRTLAFELVILGHVLFPKNSQGVDVRLLHFQEQIE